MRKAFYGLGITVLLVGVFAVFASMPFWTPPLVNERNIASVRVAAEEINRERELFPGDTEITGVAQGREGAFTLVREDSTVSTLHPNFPTNRYGRGGLTVTAEGTLDDYTLSWSIPNGFSRESFVYSSLTGEVTPRG